MDYHTGIPEMDEGLDARFEILSSTVRHLLQGDSIPNLATELARHFELTDDMRDGIETSIALILMYIEPVDEFAANLMTEYLVPPEAAIEIDKEVNAKLFAPLMNELGHSSKFAAQEGGSTVTEVPNALQAVVQPAPATAPHVPVARVMPHSAEEAQRDPRASTELPNALLQNLKASLMHSVPEEPLEGTNPAPSYNAILDQKPPAPPNLPPKS